MKLIIGHLYYDLMNLYGENGNIKVLEYQLKKQKINVEIKKLSIGDKIDFNKLDLIYIGAGTEKNRDLVLNDLLKYKDDIKKYYQSNKFLLITGNAISLFGKTINNIKALNIFNYHTKEENIRIVKEVNTKFKIINDDILGFINTSSLLYNKEGQIDGYEIIKKNFYGTILIGPILARNPEFMKYFIKDLIKFKDKKFKIKEFNVDLDTNAYKEYIEFKNKR